MRCHFRSLSPADRLLLLSRVEVPGREAGAPHRRPRAPPVPGGRAGVHPLLPGGEGPAASPRQPLHLRSPRHRQDSLPQLRAAGDEGAFIYLVIYLVIYSAWGNICTWHLSAAVVSVFVFLCRQDELKPVQTVVVNCMSLRSSHAIFPLLADRLGAASSHNSSSSKLRRLLTGPGPTV